MTLNTIYNAELVEIADESTECWADVYDRPCGRFTDHRSGLCPKHYQELVLLAENLLDIPEDAD